MAKYVVPGRHCSMGDGSFAKSTGMFSSAAAMPSGSAFLDLGFTDGTLGPVPVECSFTK